MNPLGKISFKLLNDGELLDMALKIETALADVAVEECTVLPEFKEALTASRDNLNSSLGLSRKHELTEDIQQADDMRDEALALIDDAIDYMGRKRKSAYKESALLLRELYDTAFAGININNNSEESSGIERFLAALESAEAQAAVTAIHIIDEVSDLRSGHKEYITKLQERAAQKETDATPRLVPSRREMQKDIRAFEEYLDFKIRKKSLYHNSFADSLKGSIGEIMAVAQARDSRKDSE